MNNDEDLGLIGKTNEDIYIEGANFYKAYSGVDIIKSSEDNLILSTVSAILGNIVAYMDKNTKQNYIQYAIGNRLDAKGKLFGTSGERIIANKARTTMKCYISQVVARDVVIVSGTRFIHGNYIFNSVQEEKIIAGDLFKEIIVEANIAGEVEPILAGELKEIVDKYDYYEKCENTTDVTGGTNLESDDAYRERIEHLPELFTTAGSEGSYIALTKMSSPLVYDVLVDNPTPNVLDIYVCNKQELISNEEKTKIEEFLKDGNRRPINDSVTVKDVTIKTFDLGITYLLYDNFATNKDVLELNLRTNIMPLINNLKIGEELNEQDLISISKNLGIHSIVVTGIPVSTDRLTLNKLGTLSIISGGIA